MISAILFHLPTSGLLFLFDSNDVVPSFSVAATFSPSVRSSFASRRPFQLTNYKIYFVSLIGMAL